MKVRPSENCQNFLNNRYSIYSSGAHSIRVFSKSLPIWLIYSKNNNTFLLRFVDKRNNGSEKLKKRMNYTSNASLKFL